MYIEKPKVKLKPLTQKYAVQSKQKKGNKEKKALNKKQTYI